MASKYASCKSKPGRRITHKHRKDPPLTPEQKQQLELREKYRALQERQEILQASREVWDV